MEMGVILHAPKEDKDVRILGHDSFEIIIKRITTTYVYLLLKRPRLYLA